MIESLVSESYQKETSNNNNEYKINNRKKRQRKYVTWNEDEDIFLQSLISKYGTNEWKTVKDLFNEKFTKNKKSAKNIKDRFTINFNTKSNNLPWSKDEECILFENQKILGNKWSYFTTFLPGRSDNSIKNHFYSKYRKRIRKFLKTFKKYKNEISKTHEFKKLLNEIDFKAVYDQFRAEKVQYKEINLERYLNILMNIFKFPIKSLENHIYSDLIKFYLSNDSVSNLDNQNIDNVYKNFNENIDHDDNNEKCQSNYIYRNPHEITNPLNNTSENYISSDQKLIDEDLTLSEDQTL